MQTKNEEVKICYKLKSNIIIQVSEKIGEAIKNLVKEVQEKLLRGSGIPDLSNFLHAEGGEEVTKNKKYA